MHEIIKQKLEEIEKIHNIKILYAIESGSRAWGFASPDSDYDVRFIYVRSLEYYLKLEDTKDFLDCELNETLDINGWDLRKVLQHFHKSNATLFEWSNSPVVYKTTKDWEKIYQIAKKYFSCKTSMYHYYGTANKNYREYLLEDMVKYKKYFYVLRPILAYKWIEEKRCPPPVLFSELMESMLEEEMKTTVEMLLEIKMQMNESEKAPRIEKINIWIEKNLLKMKENLDKMQDDRKHEWEDLNRIFQGICSKSQE